MVLPPGYLKQMHSATRAAGALAIADEVQTGFGRVGTHMWAFEAHRATPDIVTVGKPFGNGFPLSAVITTREVADASKGFEYFNTFGAARDSSSSFSPSLHLSSSQPPGLRREPRGVRCRPRAAVGAV